MFAAIVPICGKRPGSMIPGNRFLHSYENKKMEAEAEVGTLKLQLYKRKLHRTEDVEFVMGTMLTAPKSAPGDPLTHDPALNRQERFSGNLRAALWRDRERLARAMRLCPNAFSQRNEEYLELMNGETGTGRQR